jgi:hypothetical protein
MRVINHFLLAFVAVEVGEFILFVHLVLSPCHSQLGALEVTILAALVIAISLSIVWQVWVIAEIIY